MIVEEIEKGKEDDKVEAVEKEKGEEQTTNAPITMTQVTILNKGKQIDVEDDLSHGLVDLSTLSPLKAVKLATQAQIKASEDLLKSQSKDNLEVISLATKVLEKTLPNFSHDSGESPFGKLKNMLSVVNTNFESLEKAVDELAQKNFIEMYLQSLSKVIEGDKISLKIAVKSVEDALSEGGKIFKSCMFFT